MATVYVDRQGAELDCEADRLVVRVAGERVSTLPLRPMERLVVLGAGSRLTTRLLCRLWSDGVILAVVGQRGRLPDLHLPPRGPRDAKLRLARYETLRHPGLAQAFAVRLGRAKLSVGAANPGPVKRFAEAWKRLSSPVSLTNCLGYGLRERGQSRVPEPPQRRTG